MPQNEVINSNNMSLRDNNLCICSGFLVALQIIDWHYLQEICYLNQAKRKEGDKTGKDM